MKLSQAWARFGRVEVAGIIHVSANIANPSFIQSKATGTPSPWSAGVVESPDHDMIASPLASNARSEPNGTSPRRLGLRSIIQVFASASAASLQSLSEW